MSRTSWTYIHVCVFVCVCLFLQRVVDEYRVTSSIPAFPKWFLAHIHENLAMKNKPSGQWQLLWSGQSQTCIRGKNLHFSWIRKLHLYANTNLTFHNLLSDKYFYNSWFISKCCVLLVYLFNKFLSCLFSRRLTCFIRDPLLILSAQQSCEMRCIGTEIQSQNRSEFSWRKGHFSLILVQYLNHFTV